MFEYLVVFLVLTLTSADYDSCPKVNRPLAGKIVGALYHKL